MLFLPLIAGCFESWSLLDGDRTRDDDTALESETGSDTGGDTGDDTDDDTGQRVDLDGDGFYSLASGGDDCWDDPASTPEIFEALNGFPPLAAADVYPNATDPWYDGIDQNCAGDDDFDQDLDGFASTAWTDLRTTLPVSDCYDATSEVYPELWAACVAMDERQVSEPLAPADVFPGATDSPYDGSDANCDGQSDFDDDGDSYDSCAECDDSNADIFPIDLPEEWYNGVDENCDGNDADQDGDGYLLRGYDEASGVTHAGKLPGDCWDNPTDGAEFEAINGFSVLEALEVNPGATDRWYDAVDQDCAGDDDFDQDGDAESTNAYADREGIVGTDCDDADSGINTSATDIWYDGVDGNCDGHSDFDQDGDSHDADSFGGTDCNDTSAVVSPTAAEDCGTVDDDNCDGSDNDPNAVGCDEFYTDGDRDGFGGAESQCLCTGGDDFPVTNATDCDDSDSVVNPAASETCATAYDDDCDDSTNEFDADACVEFFADTDGDGYGSLDSACLCAAEGDYSSALSTDCDDTTGDTSPAATEVCDALDTDEDCDGLVDDADESTALITMTTFFQDGDGDGYGNPSDSDLFCDLPSGYSVDSSDCDDGDSTINPSAEDVCRDGTDQDCDGQGGTCTVAPMDWSDADAVFTGVSFGDLAGWDVQGAGDMDGDGYPDMIVGQGYTSTFYLQPGGASPASASLADATAIWSWSQDHTALASIGDFDGDTLEDIVVGMPECGGSCTTAGSAVVVLGSATPASGTNAEDLTFSGSQSSLWPDWRGEYAGNSVAGAGDFDGDGLDDLVVGAPYHDWVPGYTGDERAGAVYLVPGGSTSGSLPDFPSLVGAAYDQLGYSVSGAGDVNGDGYDDFLSGARCYSSSTCAGQAVLTLGSTAAAPARDAVVYGAAGDAAGTVVSSAGDVDGDGRDDFLVGTQTSQLGLFLGSAAPASYTDLADASALYTGSSLFVCALAPVGDFDADGFGDFLIGGVGSWCSGAQAYLVRGESSPRSADVTAGGNILDLNVSDVQGGAVGHVGDVNVDGYDDILIGEPFNSAADTSAGAAWLILGTHW